ncbi:plasmid pRiA4b ORF-3 family protein [Salininema proteolyticum]|uniref:Plasmid pRiA4b ORF-3 family protein n=1 Tax=Salininema proteolyticum TaxID=1607685 RepID=A0ABV8U4J7_9ACTN
MRSEPSLPVTAQVQRFYDWLGPGRKLTQTGNLGLKDAKALVAELGTGDEVDPLISDRQFKTHSSTDLPNLMEIYGWAHTTGFVRTVKGKLTPVKNKAKTVHDDQRLTQALFNATFQKTFLADIDPGRGSVLADDYLLGLDIIWQRFRAADTGDGVSLPVVADELWEVISPRWSWPELTDRQLESQRNFVLWDLRRLAGLYARLDAVRVHDDYAQLTEAGRTLYARAQGAPEPGDMIWQVTVELEDVENPRVWRRIEISPATTLSQFHQVIQAIFGWQNCHLHQFTIGDWDYAPTAFQIHGSRDETRVKLSTVIKVGSSGLYVYDLGDDWRHRFTIDAANMAGEGVTYPRCVDGAGTCPQEDNGGAAGWAQLKDAMADPDSPEAGEYTRWLGLNGPDDFDPDVVDLTAINSAVNRLHY